MEGFLVELMYELYQLRARSASLFVKNMKKKQETVVTEKPRYSKENSETVSSKGMSNEGFKEEK